MRKIAAVVLGFILLVSAVVLFATEGDRIHNLAKVQIPQIYQSITSPAERGDDEIAKAMQSGLAVKRRNLVALEVNRRQWSGETKLARERLLTALAYSAFGRDLRGDEVVSVYAGKSSSPLSVKRASNRSDVETR